MKFGVLILLTGWFLLVSVLARADTPFHVQITTVDLAAADAAQLKNVILPIERGHDDLVSLCTAATKLGITIHAVPTLQITTLDGVTGSADAQYKALVVQPIFQNGHRDIKPSKTLFGPSMTAFPWINSDGSFDVRISYYDWLPNPYNTTGNAAPQWGVTFPDRISRYRSGVAQLFGSSHLPYDALRLVYVTVTRLPDWEAAFLPRAVPRSRSGSVRLQFTYLDPIKAPSPISQADEIYAIGNNFSPTHRKSELANALAGDARNHITDHIVSGPTLTVRAGLPTIIDLMQKVPPGVAETAVSLDAVGESLTITPRILSGKEASLAIKSFRQNHITGGARLGGPLPPITYHEEKDYHVQDGDTIFIGWYYAADRRFRRIYVSIKLLPWDED